VFKNLLQVYVYAGKEIDSGEKESKIAPKDK
jgi:hypothetical protein